MTQIEIPGGEENGKFFIAKHFCNSDGRPVTMGSGIDPNFFVGHCFCGERLVCKGFNFNFPCEKKEKKDARKKV